MKYARYFLYALFVIMINVSTALCASEKIFELDGVGLTVTGGNDYTEAIVELDHNGTLTLSIGKLNKLSIIFNIESKIEAIENYLIKGQMWIKKNKTVHADGDKIIGDVETVNGALRLVFMADASGNSAVFLIARNDATGTIKSIFLTGNEPQQMAKALAKTNRILVMNKLKKQADMSSFN